MVCYLSDDCTLALLALTNLQPVNKAATRHIDAEVTNTTCMPSINNSGKWELALSPYSRLYCSSLEKEL